MEPSTPIYSQSAFTVRKNPHVIAIWRAFGGPTLYLLAGLSMAAFALAFIWWGIYLFSLSVPPLDNSPVHPVPLWLSVGGMPFGGFAAGAIVRELFRYYQRTLTEVEGELKP